MSYATDAAAINNKIVQVGDGLRWLKESLSHGTTQTVDGQTVYTGFADVDANHGYSGEAIVSVDKVSQGTVSINYMNFDNNLGISFTHQYQILGSDPSGMYLVLGDTNGNPQVYLQADPFQGKYENLQDFTYDSRNSFNGANLHGVIPCFVTGTRIITENGDIAVEDLKVGDGVLTLSGEIIPVRWIGHRTIRCDHCFNPKIAWPIRISAGSFGDQKPSQDLFVSPGHAIWIPFMEDGVLIPASSLVNGSTVSQVETAEVTYWHIELVKHDILLANGLPAESYIDVGNRSFFNDKGGYAGPDHPARSLDDYCRPFQDTGSLVHAVKQALKMRAFAAGWTVGMPIGRAFYIVADGKIIEPTIEDGRGRFILNADAKQVWIVSPTSVPSDVTDVGDERLLGVRLKGIFVTDGLTIHRDIDLKDTRLCAGFHDPEEGGTRRWTSGRAWLPRELWDGCRDIAVIRIDFETPLLPRWIPPQTANNELDEETLQISQATLLETRTLASAA